MTYAVDLGQVPRWVTVRVEQQHREVRRIRRVPR